MITKQVLSAYGNSNEGVDAAVSVENVFADLQTKLACSENRFEQLSSDLHNVQKSFPDNVNITRKEGSYSWRWKSKVKEELNGVCGKLNSYHNKLER